MFRCEQLTVTRQDALKPPSSVVTVIVVVPFLRGVTMPFSTVATVLSLLDQVTFLFVAVSGENIGVNVRVSPVPMLAVSLSSAMPVTGTGLFSTVTLPFEISNAISSNEILIISPAVYPALISYVPGTAFSLILKFSVARVPEAVEMFSKPPAS